MCFRPVAIETDITCPKCGTKNPVTATECSNCGATAEEFRPSNIPGVPPPPGAPAAPKPPGVPSAPGAPQRPGAPKPPGVN
jgi:DNA-directed RNA polymerase subunit RPC12/RpoP